MLTVAFGKSTMSRTQVQLWYNRFKKDQEDDNDDACPDRPSMSTTDENIVAVKKMISDNRPITIKEVADDVEVMRRNSSKTHRIVAKPIMDFAP